MPTPWSVFGSVAGGTTVKVSAGDTTAGYLDSKLVEGTGIDLTVLNPGGNEQLEISSDSGFLVVATIAARNNIPAADTQVGMFVNVLDNGAGVTALYQLTALPASTSANWVPFGIDPGITYYGAGRDGSLAPGFGAIVLTEDTYYQDITPKTDGTDTIITNGHRLRWAGTLDLSGCPEGIIKSNNTAINGGTGAAGGGAGAVGASNQAAGNSTAGGGLGGLGGAGGTVNGSQGAVGGTVGNSGGGSSGGSGKGGNAGANTGGIVRAGQTVTGSAGSRIGSPPVSINAVQPSQDAAATFVYHPLQGGAGGPGGGGGAGDGTAGGGGGGGGTGGAVLDVGGNVLIRSAATAPRCIWANAGKGGTGGSPAAGARGGGGGAGGAGGGVAMLFVAELQGTAATGLLSADGGDGGVGGTGSGAGLGGNGGDGGASGLAIFWNLAAGTEARAAAGTAGTAGGSNTGATGGTSGPGGQSRITI